VEPSNPYENDRVLGEYLLFHYGSAEETLGSFPGPSEAVGFAFRLVEELLDPALLQQQTEGKLRALDVGCAVGGSSFALRRHLQEVTGIDFSGSFIAAAKEMAANGFVETSIATEGKQQTPFRAAVPPEWERSGVSFHTGDAMDLPPELENFDVVLAANLICRLREPMRFLNRLPELVRPGGQLLLTTPFTWMEEYTPLENWLGGQEAGESSFEALEEILSPHFQLARRVEIPFLLREHARKFQYTVACGSHWIRR